MTTAIESLDPSELDWQPIEPAHPDSAWSVLVGTHWRIERDPQTKALLLAPVESDVAEFRNAAEALEYAADLTKAARLVESLLGGAA